MDAKKYNLLLIKRFPELEKSYHEEVDWQEGDETGCHVVYGDVFSPYIEKLIESNNEDKMKEIFNFLEELLNFADSYIHEVIMFSVLERLISDRERLEICDKFIKEQVKNVITSMENK